MAEKYYSILTNRGKELEAQSSATGKPVIIKDFVVGDGNGQPVKPDPALTALVREVYRAAVSALQVSPEQANQFIAQLVLPADVGGFVVREVGLLTDAGELYAVANCAAIEKPLSGISVKLQFRLAVSETADIELKVSTGDGLFLRQDANLGDVKDAAETRKNIGLKGAALLDVGTKAGTVAAGDDERITGALQKGNNLSDLVDKVKSRTNLGLGSMATQNADAVNITGGKASLSTVSTAGNISSGGNLTVTGSSTLTGQVEVKGGLISSNGYTIVRAVYENGNQYARIMLTDAEGKKTLAYLEADYGENLVIIIKGRRFILDNNGNLFVPGGVYDNGQRVYSPNNPQPVPKNTAFLGSNGWERDADTGIITQWGSFISGSTNNETRSFPIPFPNTATVVTGSIGVSGSGTVFLEQNGNGNFNSRTTSAGVGVYWTAKGY